jgi:hypothetical protein
MSTPQAQGTQADAVTQAYAHIHGQVYAPVFFEKLARDYGITPATPDECNELMTMAVKLRTAQEHTQQKQAAATVNHRDSFLKAAHARLDAVLTETGLAAQPQQVADTAAEVKSAAAMLALNPAIAQATLQLALAGV